MIYDPSQRFQVSNHNCDGTILLLIQVIALKKFVYLFIFIQYRNSTLT